MNGDKVYSVDEAKRKLEYFCSYQERCHDEVERKLREMRMIPIAVDTIIAHLIQNNFLNEERFACAFARGKHRIKKWGRIRITSELKARHISAYNIKKGLAEIEPEYLDTFEALVLSLRQSVSESNPLKKKKKMFDVLARKGYESHLIYEAIAMEL